MWSRPPKAAEIEGGVARRPFTSGDRVLRLGDTLSAEELKAMPVNNRNALIDKGFIDVTRARAPSAVPQVDEREYERVVIQRGAGQYDVLKGYVLNETSLSKKDAEALASASDEPQN